MRPQDLHTHSLFDDGKNTLEEMVCAAIEQGLSAIGFSGHSPIAGEDWTIREENLSSYHAQIRDLKEKYRNQIPIYCGIEYDIRSKLALAQFDYVIGSVHATKTEKGSFDTDNTAKIAQAGIQEFFDGDSAAAAECYFAQYAEIAANPEIDIVGHFDLLTKFNERVELYNPNEKQYQLAASKAMDCLIEAGKIFEVNTGAISRGYRTMPYPSKALLCELRQKNGKVCLSSDAHSANGIACSFAQSVQLIKECGFEELWMLSPEGFVPIKLSEIQL